MGAPATALATAPAEPAGLFSLLAPGGKRVLFALTAVAVCLLLAFPVFWLILTSLRPASGVYYVHRGTEFTLDNFSEVLSHELVLKALFNETGTQGPTGPAVYLEADPGEDGGRRCCRCGARGQHDRGARHRRQCNRFRRLRTKSWNTYAPRLFGSVS
jgi:ABC-type maltose transport system permease subunit